MLIIYLFLIFISNISSKPSAILDGGYSFGMYNPRLKLKASFQGSPGKKLINTSWSQNLIFGAGGLLVLKETDTYKGLFFNTGYSIYKKLPFEHTCNIELGFYKKMETFYYGSNYAVSYYINSNLDFRSTLGLSRAINTNLDILFGIKFKI